MVNGNLDHESVSYWSSLIKTFTGSAGRNEAGRCGSCWRLPPWVRRGGCNPGAGNPGAQVFPGVNSTFLLQQSTRDYIDSHYTTKPEVFVSSPRKDAAASSPAARRKQQQDGGSPRSRRGSSPRSRRGSLLPPGDFRERRGSLVQVCRERREGSRRKGGSGSSIREKENGSRRENGSRKENGSGRRERPRHLPCREDRAKAL